jgi:hypothetical protein
VAEHAFQLDDLVLLGHNDLRASRRIVSFIDFIKSISASI